MNTKDNQRSRLTRMLLKQAFLNLMKQKPAEKITVKEICEKAEVNRSTFYLHFAEPNDVLKELEDEAILQISEVLHYIAAFESSGPDMLGSLYTFLHYIRKNDDMFRCLLVENSDPHFRRKLFDLSMNVIPSSFDLPLDPFRKEMACRFMISGSLELLTFWIKSDYRIPDSQMGELLSKLCEGSLKELVLTV